MRFSLNKLFLAITVFSSTGFAEPVKIKPYMGISAGYSSIYGPLTANVYNNTPLLDSGASQKLSSNPKGFSGGPLLGLRFQKDNSFFAIETYTDFSKIKESQEAKPFYNNNHYAINSGLEFSVENKRTHALSFILGKAFDNDIEVFFKLDLLASKFALGFSSTEDPYSGKHEKWAFGLGPGVGIQAKAFENVVIRLDYSHRFYNSIKTPNMSGNYSLHFVDQVQTRISPRSHNITVGLIYMF